MDVIAETGLSYNCLEAESWQQLICKLRPSAAVKPVSPYHAKKRMGERACAKMTIDIDAMKSFLDDHPGLAYALTSDGWKNVSREHVDGCLVHLMHLMAHVDLCGTGSEHDGVSCARGMVKQLEDARKVFGHDAGSFCTDDSASCGRARRILAYRIPWIVFCICFAHQVC